MSADSPLNALLQRARSAEAPGVELRAQLRSQLQRRIDSPSPADAELERALFAEPPARPWQGLLRWALPAGGMALIAAAYLAVQPSSSPSSSAAAPVEAAAPAAVAAAAPAAGPASAAAAAPASLPAPPPASAAGAATPPAAAAAARSLIQAALRDGHWARALRLLDEQDREFAGGALVEERAAARAIAQCIAGSNAAAGVAAAFLERYPRSMLAPRVQSACARALPAKAEP
jgi:hypothetical protein